MKPLYTAPGQFRSSLARDLEALGLPSEPMTFARMDEALGVQFTAPAKGGKRPGSGRKPLDADGTVVTTVRLTAKQKASFEMAGGVQWLRGQLDLFAGD